MNLKTFVLLLALTSALSAAAESADELTTMLNGTSYQIDADGTVWVDQGLWIAIDRSGLWKNTQRIAASDADNLLVVLQNNLLQYLNPSTAAYKALTPQHTYEPHRMTGLCAQNGYAYFIYDDQLFQARLDGTGGPEPLRPWIRWVNTEGMAANGDTMIVIQNGVLHRLFSDGSFKVLTPGVNWSGTTSVVPGAGGYFVKQGGVIHWLYDVDGSGAYSVVKR